MSTVSTAEPSTPTSAAPSGAPRRRRAGLIEAWRAAVGVGYAAYLGYVAYLVWSPQPAMPSNAVDLVVRAAARLDVTVSASMAEFALNVAMLVPLSFVGGILFRRLSVGDWTLIGFATSCTVEALQFAALPTRDPSARDIVANTGGALFGALALAVVLSLLMGSPKLRRP